MKPEKTGKPGGELVEVPIPIELFKLLQYAAKEMGTTPDRLAEEAVKNFLEKSYRASSPCRKR